MSRFNPRATQVLTRTDGGKLEAVSGRKLSNSRSSCSTSYCTPCHFDSTPFKGISGVMLALAGDRLLYLGDAEAARAGYPTCYFSSILAATS